MKKALLFLIICSLLLSGCTTETVENEVVDEIEMRESIIRPYDDCIELLKSRMYQAERELTEAQNMFEDGYFREGLTKLDMTRASMFNTECGGF